MAIAIDSLPYFIVVGVEVTRGQTVKSPLNNYAPRKPRFNRASLARFVRMAGENCDSQHKRSAAFLMVSRTHWSCLVPQFVCPVHGVTTERSSSDAQVPTREVSFLFPETHFFGVMASKGWSLLIILSRSAFLPP